MKSSESYDASVYWQIRDRYYGIFNKDQQRRLQSSQIAIVGLGCVGELEAVMLARMGVGNLILIDYDRVEISNIGRSTFSLLKHVGEPKVLISANFLSEIDPTIRIQVFNEKFTFETGPEMIKNADVVLQAVDHMVSRVVIHRVAKRLNKTVVTMSGGPPYRAIVSVFSPNTPDYEEFFNLPTKELDDKILESSEHLHRELRKERVRYSMSHGANESWAKKYLSGEREIWAVSIQRPYITSVLAVHEAVKVILGMKNIAWAPLYYDLDLDRFESPVVLRNAKENPVDYRRY